MNTKPPDIEIPLEFAIIGWTPITDNSFPSGYSHVCVLDSRTHRIPEYFKFKRGAVFDGWANQKTPYKRLLELLWIRGELIADRICIEEIDNAMSAIPEFVAYINGEESKD